MYKINTKLLVTQIGVLTPKCCQSTQTYYDILNVKSDCTEQEIRAAFIKLSKQYHPDTSKVISKYNSIEFQKILEAYKVLSKSRGQYDTGLHMDRAFGKQAYPGSFGRKPTWVRPEPGPYYGIKGMKRVSNSTIVVALALFACVGVVAQFFAIRKSVTFRREVLDNKSIEAGHNLSNARADAQRYGNEKQLERLLAKHKIKTAENSNSESV